MSEYLQEDMTSIMTPPKPTPANIESGVINRHHIKNI